MSKIGELPEAAQKAWDAYCEMGTSKQAYFSFLQALDQKYKQQGSPSIAENLKLEDLLKIHDKKVSAFNEAMQAIDDKDARELLLKKLTEDASKSGTH